MRKEPLTHRQVLVALEALYDLVLHIEQLRRNPPNEEDDEAVAAWYVVYVISGAMLSYGFCAQVGVV